MYNRLNYDKQNFKDSFHFNPFLFTFGTIAINVYPLLWPHLSVAGIFVAIGYCCFTGYTHGKKNRLISFVHKIPPGFCIHRGGVGWGGVGRW